MSFSNEFHQIRSRQRARDMIFAVVASVVVFATILAIGQTVRVAVAGDTGPVVAAPKADRLSSSLPASCDNETWGNWSPACMAAISGHETMRQVRFETFEIRPAQQNVSVLERVATQS